MGILIFSPMICFGEKKNGMRQKTRSWESPEGFGNN